MSPEFIVMYSGIAAAAVSCWTAYKYEKKRGKRFFAILAFILAIIGLLGGGEIYSRKGSIEELTQELNRKWFIFQDIPAQALEIEFVTPDGFFNLGEILREAANIRFEINGVEFVSDTDEGRKDEVLFSKLITPDALKTNSRLGIARATIQRSDKDDKKVAEVISSTCTASHYTTKQVLADAGDFASRVVCSAAVILPLTGRVLRLREIASSPDVSLTIREPMSFKCLSCKSGIVSIRLILMNSDSGNLFPDMIELSPMAYLSQPSKISEQEIAYSLSGETLVALAKSYYSGSYGYRDQSSFMMTRGAIYGLYRWLTTKQETMKYIDTIWSTDSDLDDSLLKSILPPGESEASIPFRAAEWCGFGGRPVCWYRYVVFEESK